jgi:hypothetical protein
MAWEEGAEVAAGWAAERGWEGGSAVQWAALMMGVDIGEGMRASSGMRRLALREVRKAVVGG